MKYLILLLFFCGCYNQRKATTQFSKAVVAFPKIGAEYCANEFPVKDSIIKDTVITTDTLYADGIIYDTVFVQDFDTVRIYITKQLPGKVITNTIHVTDTIFQTNTAALKACEIDKSTLTDLLKSQTDETNKYKGQAKKRGWWMWSLIALIVAVIGLNIYLKAKGNPFKT